MGSNQKRLLTIGMLFILLLISYKFSLLHDTNMLPYLMGTTIPPFQRILTYVFMMIGLIPTILLILYTSTLCHTEYISNAVQTICFGTPFHLSDSSGFFAYIVASLITMVIFLYLATSLERNRV